MSKIGRVFQKIFAGSVPVTNVISQFGSLKDAAPVFSGDPDIIQALTAYDEGWGSALIANINPAMQDLNALLYLVSRQISYSMQAGIPEWSSLAAYYIGSLVTDSTGAIFCSVSDTNTNVALTDTTKWRLLLSRNVVTATVNYSVLYNDWYIRFTGDCSTTAKDRVTLPAPTATNKGRKITIKCALSPNPNSFKVIAGDSSTIDGNATYTYPNTSGKQIVRTFISDGTNWQVVQF